MVFLLTTFGIILNLCKQKLGTNLIGNKNAEHYAVFVKVRVC